MPYIGEIRIFGGNFAPVGWLFCEGQLLPIAENSTLFTLIGTTYGGDGQATFALPDLRGRLPVHMVGQAYTIGSAAGVESVTLSTQQLPIHTHPMLATADLASEFAPGGKVFAQPQTVDAYVQSPPFLPLSPQSISPVGGSQPHTNMQPYLCVNYIISLFGVFPTQT